MLNRITQLTIALFAFLLGLQCTQTEYVTEYVPTFHNSTEVDTVRLYDTVYIADGKRFESIDDYILFVKYIKTQSKRVTDDLGQQDIWAVIQTMKNRMVEQDAGWRKFYRNKSINHSHSMDLMKAGKLKPSFDWNNWADVWMIECAMKCNAGEVPDSLRLDSDVLYFESFRQCPNRGVHLCRNLVTQYRHKFYRKE